MSGSVACDKNRQSILVGLLHISPSSLVCRKALDLKPISVFLPSNVVTSASAGDLELEICRRPAVASGGPVIHHTTRWSCRRPLPFSSRRRSASSSGSVAREKSRHRKSPRGTATHLDEQPRVPQSSGPQADLCAPAEQRGHVEDLELKIAGGLPSPVAGQ